jgi:hypothetical protein
VDSFQSDFINKYKKNAYISNSINKVVCSSRTFSVFWLASKHIQVGITIIKAWLSNKVVMSHIFRIASVYAQNFNSNDR